jgi:hypothetical protein
MSFKYLYIPASEGEAVVELTASKSGGLENDALRKNAEGKFSGGDIDREEQRKAVTKQLEGKGIASSKVDEILNGDAGMKLAGSVEIITLAVPTRQNNYESVSLYCDGNSAFKEGGKVPNNRATAIARACGHASLMVMGDCFIGRALDDESKEWERLDFTEADLNGNASWVQAAARSNAGKNLSNYSTSGALNALQNTSSSTPGHQKAAVAEPPASEFSSSEMYVWSQSEEDVEVRMKLPAGLLSKQLCVQIGANRLYVGRKGAKDAAQAAIPGIDARFAAEEGPARGALLAGTVSPGDSTWSVAEEREGRLLTVVLAKGKKQHWSALVA